MEVAGMSYKSMYIHFEFASFLKNGTVCQQYGSLRLKWLDRLNNATGIGSGTSKSGMAENAREPLESLRHLFPFKTYFTSGSVASITCSQYRPMSDRLGVVTSNSGMVKNVGKAVILFNTI